MKPSLLILLVLGIGTLISAYFNYQDNKLVMSAIGVLISVFCFGLFFKERNKDSEK